jgi:CMD domain protein
MADLMDSLIGVARGSAMDAIRARRPAAREHAQASYRVLFEPDAPGAVSAAERWAVGAYVTALHGPGPVAAHYAAGLAAQDATLARAVAAAAQATRAPGPSGAYPAGPLSTEDTPAPAFALDAATAAALGPRLAAALAHTHYLVLHPRDAAPERFAPLLAAGWSTDGIVTLSQIVSFLAFQIRAVAGLAVLAAMDPKAPA